MQAGVAIAESVRPNSFQALSSCPEGIAESSEEQADELHAEECDNMDRTTSVAALGAQKSEAEAEMSFEEALDEHNRLTSAEYPAGSVGQPRGTLASRHWSCLLYTSPSPRDRG